METEISFGCASDIAQRMDLVKQLRNHFPGLETPEALEAHQKTVLEFMDRDAAICAKTDGRIVGVLLFSKEDNALCYLAVDERCRRQHIAERMVSYMLHFMDTQRDVTVTTYREGAPDGEAARAFYKRMGFSEGRLTEEFGSPVQEFVRSWKVLPA